MATTKKTTPKSKSKSESKSKSKPKASATTFGSSEPLFNAYIRLRTVLDGLEANALRYCLQSERSTVRMERAEEIISLVMPLVDDFQMKLSKVTSHPGCAEGYFNCGGVCVPYACIEGGETWSEASVSALKK